MDKPPLSQQFKTWIDSGENKTLAGFIKTFPDQTFAMLFLVLMVWSATPLPTGGVTHVFELITMLLALELAAGKTVWLPKSWLRLRIGQKGLSAVPRFFARFERISRPRLVQVMQSRRLQLLTGAGVFLLALAAFLAPPFSALDTLPSVGVLLIALALLMRDAVIYLLGWLVGIAGVALEIGFGSLIYRWLF